jgi:hypothetical protein
MDLQEHTNVSEEHISFSPEDGGSMFFQNVDVYLQVHMSLQPRISTLTQIAVCRKERGLLVRPLCVSWGKLFYDSVSTSDDMQHRVKQHKGMLILYMLIWWDMKNQDSFNS